MKLKYKNADQSNQAGRFLRNKSVERLFIAGALVGTVIAILLYSHLFGRLSGQFTPPKSTIYGVWVEQNVAPYMAQRIEVQPNAIIIDGRVVSTSYQYNGRYLSFTIADQPFQYQMLNEENTEMKLISSNRYNPIFQLSEKHKKNLQ
ncbi:DUF2850 domain-containing protein [Vibrio cincinnatiensis]|uniref:DUF2850 domain-containing protein n=1 Tax=Vibrio cincinnatiensis DSM 19608 TaxID=1123491 RepID=A0A1T4N6X8_VIBCI|nr:DUF2850 domain-containing protein [Vibrio cincinnatiensis]MCG3765973.1 DUF2850 domain-containing protein [Vibrio cincinnatiensis]SJZ74982.1 Protein of unknown function [Vibrio cincinnatiensis DSM 19608]SUP49189.1 N-acetylglutamate synthase [Vibrio cincinnatiensis]